MDPSIRAPFGAIEDGAIGIQDGRILRVGRRVELAGYRAKRVESLDGAWVTPGLIDCHTHLVFGGNRAAEFEQRLQGATYEDIARAGGGIAASVAATRAASLAELTAKARPRLRALMAGGVTTIEIKSGYGLDPAAEIKILKAARALGESEPVRVVPTLLALHALPVEFRERREDFVRLATEEMIPAAAGLAQAVDAFCEGIGFTPKEVRSLFEAARAHGLRVKIHAEQLSNLYGAALAAEFGALSADHLEFVDEAGVKAMAKADMVAVLLPGAFYALQERKKPPVALLRKHRVRMAVATDCNPGTSPVLSPTLMLNMACTLFDLAPEEALAGMTVNAAKALALDHEIGTVTAGKAADLCIWPVSRPAELCYWIGLPGPDRRIVGGTDH
ncbi:imidazolonepropionase [Sphingosinicella sp. GR2756]|uniref:Imidazolonepropionase n=2 Tax=Sphingosinicella rhizophila TaxID=3050082 RepID=A0ABU3QD90_9SPHN|nr:imidazolonepropionase [Sphingosinicella sp. GR2756]MDT9600958.1 imidazolonepropionase [Sphingosinicella sp. GR2756]